MLPGGNGDFAPIGATTPANLRRAQVLHLFTQIAKRWSSRSIVNNHANLPTITPDAINHCIINGSVCSGAVIQLTQMPMPVANFPFAVYQSILEPWTRLAMKSPDVVNLRMMSMPWLMLTDPVQAAREIEQMLTEKHDALTETMFAISQTPMQLWFDMANACWSANPHLAFNAAVVNSSRRVAHPSNKRVKANRKRLGNLH